MKTKNIIFVLATIFASNAVLAADFQLRLLNRGLSPSTTTTAPSAGAPLVSASSGSTSSPLPRVFAQWDPNATGPSYTISGTTLNYVMRDFNTGSARTDVGLRTGKWYWEVTRDAGVEYQGIGVVSSTVDTVSGYPFGYNPSEMGFRVAYENKAGWGSNIPDVKNTLMPKISGDVLGFAVDMNTGVLYIYENCSATPYFIWSGMTGTWYPTVSTAGGKLGVKITANFGATPFKCTPPDGFNPGLWRH